MQQYQKVKKSKEEVESDNQKFMEIAIPLLLILVVFLLFPSFVFALLFLVPLSYVGKKTRRITGIILAVGIIFYYIQEPMRLFGYYGLLRESFGLNIEWFNSVLNFTFNQIPIAGFQTFLIYVLGGAVLALPLIEYKEYKKALRVDTKEDERNSFYASNKYKKTKENRMKTNEKLQQKWRKDPKNKVLVGIDENNQPVYMDFGELNQHAFVSATTGGGKTVLLMSFVEYAVMKNYPVLFIDGKGSASTIEEFENINQAHNRDVIVFGDSYNVTYNPIKYGNSQIIGDKLRQLVETESTYYSNINDLLIQNLIMFIDDYGFKRDLETFAYYLDKDNVKDVLNNDYTVKTIQVETQTESDDPLDIGDSEAEKQYETREVKEKTERSNNYQYKFFDGYKDSKEGEDYLFIHGSSVRTEILKITESELGHLFKEDENSVDLVDVSRNNKSIFISFDGTIYQKFIERTARFMILDVNYLVSLRNRKTENVGDNPFLTIYDEFGVYATDKIIDTINKSREAGFHCVISTQSMHDLSAIDTTFTDRVLANTNTYFVGQVNEDSEVDRWSKIFGTYKDQEITNMTELGTKSKLKRKEEKGDRGTARAVQKYSIEPQQLRHLSVGQFVLQRKSKGLEEEPKVVYARNPLTNES